MTSLPLPNNGITVVTNTSAAPVHNFYCALQAIADTVIASITLAPGFSSTGSVTSLTSIKAGTIIYCRFSTLTLTSGQVVLYKE